MCRTALWVRGGCAGFLPYFRVESCEVTFCAGFVPIFRANESCLSFRAGFLPYFRQDCPEVPSCAGIGYLFPRGMEKCSRLRGKTFPNPPGLPGVTFLRRNRVSFSARNGKMLPPALENLPKSARGARSYLSAPESTPYFRLGATLLPSASSRKVAA